MKYDGPEVAEDLGEFDMQQMRAFVKAVKHCRLRCRNNTALNNWLNRSFPNYKFDSVSAVNDRGEHYDKLRIQER